MAQTPSKRLESLDILRGFDLFCLIILCPFLHAFNHTGDYAWMTPLMRQFDHVAWEGFAFWDIVMPLFMFMAGVSIPFAFSKYLKAGEGYKAIYIRIIRRVAILWLLGCVCQGNLLALDLGVLKVFSNTLQAIAVGYLISSLLFLHLNLKWQVIVTVSILLLYWALMTFITMGEYGGGDYTPSGNLAEGIDRVVLARWRDGAYTGENGDIVFPEWYTYTWILSSLNFGVTVMTGVFAGQILKNLSGEKRKIKYLFLTGIAMVLVGWLWHLELPVIKRIWTSSMVLVSSGYCFLLMGFFYYIVDYRGYKKGLQWLKIIGMNSIVAYILSVEVGVFNFSCLSRSLFYGFEQYMGESVYHLLILSSNMAIVYAILYLLYRNKIFFKA